MTTTLVSRNNSKIRQIHRLISQHKQRAASGLFVVEGIWHVGEACAAHAGVEYICYAPSLLTSEFAQRLVNEQSALGVPCLAVSGETFSSLASKDNPQGILAVVRQPPIELASLSAQNFTFGVALVAPQDPGNIGTIMRTVDAVGASGLLLLDDREHKQFSADAYHPHSVRASMGAIFWYPVIATPFTDFVQWAKENRCHIYGTSAHASEDYRSIERYEQPLVLLMGSEREGLYPDQSAICDRMLRIPMHGRVTSLNLAVATGLMLYSIADKIR